jgi:hypothetical protein
VLKCEFPQGLKPNSLCTLTARLKPCPFKAKSTTLLEPLLIYFARACEGSGEFAVSTST